VLADVYFVKKTFVIEKAGLKRIKIFRQLHFNNLINATRETSAHIPSRMIKGTNFRKADAKQARPEPARFRKRYQELFNRITAVRLRKKAIRSRNTPKKPMMSVIVITPP